MLRARVRREMVIMTGLVGVLVLLAAFSFRGASGASSAPPPSARPTATGFAQTYVAYLDGRLSVDRLTGASPGVQALARSGGVLPAADRAGTLTLRRLDFSGVQGARSAKASLVAGDRRHTLQAAFSLTAIDGHWSVTYLVPPDLSTILAPPPPRNQLSPAARRAAVSFALAYAAYRAGSSRRLPAGLPYIRQQIAAARDPLAGIARTRSRPRLISMDALAQGALVSADAMIATGGRRHSFGFILQSEAGRWQAWQFPVSTP